MAVGEKVKAGFLIKASESDVITERGVRAFVMERLLNSPFEKGSVANLDDKTVEVLLEGDEKDIRKFKEKLEHDLTAKLGNPIIVFTDTQETGNEIPNIMKSSQALMAGQLEKGIDVQLKILDSLNNMNHGLKEEMRGLNHELKEELRAIPREIKEELKIMNQGIREELRALPREIAKAMGRA